MGSSNGNGSKGGVTVQLDPELISASIAKVAAEGIQKGMASYDMSALVQRAVGVAAQEAGFAGLVSKAVREVFERDAIKIAHDIANGARDALKGAIEVSVKQSMVRLNYGILCDPPRPAGAYYGDDSGGNGKKWLMAQALVDGAGNATQAEVIALREQLKASKENEQKLTTRTYELDGRAQKLREQLDAAKAGKPIPADEPASTF